MSKDEVTIPYMDPVPIYRQPYLTFGTDFIIGFEDFSNIDDGIETIKNVTQWLMQNVGTINIDWTLTIGNANSYSDNGKLLINMYARFIREEDLVAFRLRWGNSR